VTNLSPSKVDCFAGCPRLFFYRYIKRLPTGENKYFLIGNIAHKALELFHEELLRSKKNVSLKKFMGECFRTAIEKYGANKKISAGVIVRQDLLNIKEMLLKYIKNIDINGMPVVKCVEKMYKFPIGNITVQMKADRLDILGEHRYKVVDYKTSSKPAPKKDELASVQIPTYGLWVLNDIDKEAEITGEYQYLRHVDRKAGIRTYPVTEDMMSTAKEKYIKTAEALSSGSCTFEQNFKYKYCGRVCDYAARCLGEDAVT